MLTRREAFAAAALQGLLTNEEYRQSVIDTVADEVVEGKWAEEEENDIVRGMIAFDAVHLADKLAKALDHKVVPEVHEWSQEIRDGDGAEFHRTSGAI